MWGRAGSGRRLRRVRRVRRVRATGAPPINDDVKRAPPHWQTAEGVAGGGGVGQTQRERERPAQDGPLLTP